MVKRVCRGCVAVFVSAVVPAVSGVAEAVPPPMVKNFDPYTVTLSLENVAIQSVPNMAAAPYVREGFITATSKLDIVCKDGAKDCDLDTPWEKLEMFAQVGCPMDISGGMTPSLGPNVGSALPFPGILSAILPPPTPTPGPAPNDLTDIAIAPNAQINPQIQVKPKPGYIRNVSLGDVTTPDPPDGIPEKIEELTKKVGAIGDQVQKISDKIMNSDDPLEAHNEQQKKLPNEQQNTSDKKEKKYPVTISVQNLHMEVDQTENTLGSCGGTVAVRIYARAVVRTTDSEGTVDVYGDIYTL